jgi:hypothetical protein
VSPSLDSVLGKLILAFGTVGKRNECFIMYWQGEEAKAKDLIEKLWSGEGLGEGKEEEGEEEEGRGGRVEATNYEFRSLALFF